MSEQAPLGVRGRFLTKERACPTPDVRTRLVESSEEQIGNVLVKDGLIAQSYYGWRQVPSLIPRNAAFPEATQKRRHIVLAQTFATALVAKIVGKSVGHRGEWYSPPRVRKRHTKYTSIATFSDHL